MDKGKIIFIISILLIPVILFSLNIKGTAFNPKYYESETGQNLINYLQNPTASEELISEFSENEHLHLKDVQNLFLLNTIILAAALILLIILPKTKLSKTLIYGGILAIISTLILILLVWNFDRAFTAFHHVFFTGNWQFPEGSLLITLFTEKFFMQMTRRIITNILITSAIFVAIGFFFKKLLP